MATKLSTIMNEMNAAVQVVVSRLTEIMALKSTWTAAAASVSTENDIDWMNVSVTGEHNVRLNNEVMKWQFSLNRKWSITECVFLMKQTWMGMKLSTLLSCITSILLSLTYSQIKCDFLWCDSLWQWMFVIVSVYHTGLLPSPPLHYLTWMAAISKSNLEASKHQKPSKNITDATAVFLLYFSWFSRWSRYSNQKPSGLKFTISASQFPIVEWHYVTKSCKTAIFSCGKAMDCYLNLKLCYLDFVIEVLPMWCSLLHLQCIAPVFWALTWCPTGCLMASDRQPLPPVAALFLQTAWERGSWAFGPKGREHKHTAASTLRQDERGNHREQVNNEHTHWLHANTHTHTHTHTGSLLHAFRLSLLKAQRCTCAQHGQEYVDSQRFYLYVIPKPCSLTYGSNSLHSSDFSLSTRCWTCCRDLIPFSHKSISEV